MMLTTLTLDILNSKSFLKKNKDLSGKNEYRFEIINEITKEQMNNQKNEKIENFIIFLPLLVLLFGVIVMYILEKIFL